MLNNDRLFYEKALKQRTEHLTACYESRIEHLQKKRLESLRWTRASGLTTLIGGLIFLIIIVGAFKDQWIVFLGIVSLVIGRGMAYIIMKYDPPKLDDYD